MIALGVRLDIKQVTKSLNRLQRNQVPFATALALTKTAQKVKKAEIGAMKGAFNSPTKYTLNAVFLKAAKKKNLIAIVWLKDEAFKGTPAGKYLLPQIEGGSRRLKRSEKLLGGKYYAPGTGAKLNRFGNIPKGQIVKALANVKALSDPHQRTRKGGRGHKKSQYFYATINNTTAIWKRQGKKKIRPFMVQVRKPHYKKRLDFFGVADKVSKRNFLKEFNIALQRAIDTAR